MSKKTYSGAEFKAYYSDPNIWEKDGSPVWYVEDLEIDVLNSGCGDIDQVYKKFGEYFERLPDDAVVSILGGEKYLQGRGQYPRGAETSIAKDIEAWKKNRTTITLVASFEFSALDEKEADQIHRVLSSLGAQVLRSDDQQLDILDEDIQETRKEQGQHLDDAEILDIAIAKFEQRKKSILDLVEPSQEPQISKTKARKP